MNRQISLFEDERLNLNSAIELSLSSLRDYGRRYPHWAIAYSGGKDSSATVTFVAWAIKSGFVTAPKSLTVLYADTRQELPPLQKTALRLFDVLHADGFETRVVLPSLDNRFYIYMLGRGVPPPKNRFRWCTPRLKVEPMMAALSDLRQLTGEKLLMMTGVRLGESVIRDRRIALSCSKDGECGQGMFHNPNPSNEEEMTTGWFQPSPPDAIADTLAPLVHWRLCHVYDWLYFEQERHGYDVSGIALIYGDDDVRTGCIGCNLVNDDIPLKRLIQRPEWSHLVPLLELKPLFQDLTKAKWRKRKSEPEIRKDGTYSQNVQRLGPLTMEARAYGLEQVLDIQSRAKVDLINFEEETRIRQLWQLNTWPDGWTGDEIVGDQAIDALRLTSGGEIVSQGLLVR